MTDEPRNSDGRTEAEQKAYLLSRATDLEKIAINQGGALSSRLASVEILLGDNHHGAALTLLQSCIVHARQLEFAARRLDEKVNPAFGR